MSKLNNNWIGEEIVIIDSQSPECYIDGAIGTIECISGLCYKVSFIDDDSNFQYWNVYPQELRLVNDPQKTRQATKFYEDFNNLQSALIEHTKDLFIKSKTNKYVLAEKWLPILNLLDNLSYVSATSLNLVSDKLVLDCIELGSIDVETRVPFLTLLEIVESFEVDLFGYSKD